MIGYPILDAFHPLYEEQQNGWPNYPQPHLAWRATYEQADKPGKADSKTHPAYAPGFIKNEHATTPDDDDAKTEEASEPISSDEDQATRR